MPLARTVFAVMWVHPQAITSLARVSSKFAPTGRGLTAPYPLIILIPEFDCDDWRRLAGLRSFIDLDRTLGGQPARLGARLARLDVGRGREGLYRNQLPELLRALSHETRIRVDHGFERHRGCDRRFQPCREAGSGRHRTQALPQPERTRVRWLSRRPGRDHARDDARTHHRPYLLHPSISSSRSSSAWPATGASSTAAPR